MRFSNTSFIKSWNIWQTSRSSEIIVFAGCPGLGKTTFFRRHFSHYVHVNQDILKRREKCIAIVEESLKAGKSCVVDNTNRDRATRKFYIDVAQRLKVPIRCFVFRGDIELAWHNIIYRTWCRSAELQQREVSHNSLTCALNVTAIRLNANLSLVVYSSRFRSNMKNL